MEKTENQRVTPILKKRLSCEWPDHLSLPFAFDNLMNRTLLSYLKTRARKFPRGLIDDADLVTLKQFVVNHPDLSERCGVTQDQMDILLNAVGGVQGG